MANAEDKGIGRWPLALLIGVLVLAAFLRLWNLRTNPKWYSDELFHLKISQDLLAGDLRIRALSWTGFSPFHPYPVGFYLVSLPFLALFGGDILGLRLLTAGLGLATTYVLYAAGRRLCCTWVGLLAGFLFAIHPRTVIFNRWGFPHNQGMFFVALTLLGCVWYRERRDLRSLLFLAISSALTVVSVYWAAPLVLVVYVFVAAYDRRKLVILVPISLSLFIIQFITMVAVFGGDTVFYDIARMFSARVQEHDFQRGTASGEVWQAIQGFWHFFRMGIDPVLLLGLVGIFLMRARWQSLLLVFSFLVLAVEPLRQRGQVSFAFFYNALAFVPILVLGAANLAQRIAEPLWRKARAEERLLARLPVCIAVLVGALYAGHLLVEVTTQVCTAAHTDIDYLCVDDWRQAEETADWLNSRTEPSDFVVASTQLCWLLDCDATDLMQLAAREYGNTIWYPRGIPKSRFLYDCRLVRARFLVTDNHTYNWTVGVPNCAITLRRAELAGWPLVARHDEFLVFANPSSMRPDAAVLEERPLVVRHARLYASYGDQAARGGDQRRAVAEYEKALRMTQSGEAPSIPTTLEPAQSLAIHQYLLAAYQARGDVAKAAVHQAALSSYRSPSPAP